MRALWSASSILIINISAVSPYCYVTGCIVERELATQMKGMSGSELL